MTATAAATRRQHDAILDAIRASVTDRGYPPSMRELGQIIDRSPGQVLYHLRQLETLGRIRRTPGTSRGIEIVEDDQAVTDEQRHSAIEAALATATAGLDSLRDDRVARRLGKALAIQGWQLQPIRGAR